MKEKPPVAGRKFTNNVHANVISVMLLSTMCNNQRNRRTKDFCMFKTPLVLP